MSSWELTLGKKPQIPLSLEVGMCPTSLEWLSSGRKKPNPALFSRHFCFQSSQTPTLCYTQERRCMHRRVCVHWHTCVWAEGSVLCHRCLLCPARGAWRTSSFWSRRSTGRMRWAPCSGQGAPLGPCRRAGWVSTSLRPSWGCWTTWWVSCPSPFRPVLSGLASPKPAGGIRWAWELPASQISC